MGSILSVGTTVTELPIAQLSKAFKPASFVEVNDNIRTTVYI